MAPDVAPNDRRENTRPQPTRPTHAHEALPADLRPVHELLGALSASWQRQLPPADALNARLPLLLQDAPDSDAGSVPDAGRTRPALREYHHPIGDGDITGRGTLSRHGPSHRLFAAVAALLLIALGGSVFAVFAAQRPVPGTTVSRPTVQSGTPTPTTPPITRILAPQPQNTRLPVPANAYIQGISFSSAGDGWVTGGIRVPDYAGADFSVMRTQLVHYHNGQWTAAQETFKYGSVDAVSMVSADEGWAIGSLTSDLTFSSNTPPTFLHYTGGHWHGLGQISPQIVSLDTLHMYGSGWGYATGTMDIPVPGQSSSSPVLAIAVYQAGVWRVIQTSFEAFASYAVMVSPDDGWVLGKDQQRDGMPGIYHYTHGAWNQTVPINDDAYPSITLRSLSAASSQDMWATGTACTALGSGQQLNCHILAYHFDGTRWQSVAPPDLSSVSWSHSTLGMQVFADETGAAWLSFATEDDSLPPAQRRYEPFLYRYTHGQWAAEAVPVAHVILVAFASDHNGGTWAVGWTDNPYASYVFYTQGDGTWYIYGHN